MHSKSDNKETMTGFDIEEIRACLCKWITLQMSQDKRRVW